MNNCCAEIAAVLAPKDSDNEWPPSSRVARILWTAARASAYYDLDVMTVDASKASSNRTEGTKHALSSNGGKNGEIDCTPRSKKLRKNIERCS
jgi:hypothetical protein